MTTSTPSPLREILERKHGTLRFGHALRLLGQVNHARLVETLDLLESASTLEQFLNILRQAVQACALASAKSPFVIVPTDEDLGYLLDDVAHYGVRLIASLLLILSALRYPLTTSETRGQIAAAGSAAEDTQEGKDQSLPLLKKGATEHDRSSSTNTGL